MSNPYIVEAPIEAPIEGTNRTWHSGVGQHQTRYVPRNMGMPPACKVCMSYIFHALLQSTKAMYLQIHSK